MSENKSETTEQKFYNWMNEFQNPNNTVSYIPSNAEIWSWIEAEMKAEKEKIINHLENIKHQGVEIGARQTETDLLDEIINELNSK